MRVSIVGNGLIDPKFFDDIESSDFIVRFNNPPLEHQYPGMTTDQLVLTNATSRTTKLLRSSRYLSRPVWVGAKTILLPLHPEITRQFARPMSLYKRLLRKRRDKTDVIRRVAQAAGKPVDVLPAEAYLGACGALGIAGEQLRKIMPSSGMLTIFHYLQILDVQVSLFGFNFQGTDAHDWVAEELWLKNQIQTGRVRTHG